MSRRSSAQYQRRYFFARVRKSNSNLKWEATAFLQPNIASERQVLHATGNLAPHTWFADGFGDASKLFKPLADLFVRKLSTYYVVQGLVPIRHHVTRGSCCERWHTTAFSQYFFALSGK
jgi:hypothetical protein